MKNRRDDGGFNRNIAAYTFDGSTVTEEWVFDATNFTGSDGHNTRVVDVNGDGADEYGEIGFVLNGDGTVRYNLDDQGVVHGDRWHIAKIDPESDDLQGYGIQQDNEDLLYEYYYDAATGEIIWKHYGDDVGDVGRGLCSDIDPNFSGMECWSFSGLYNAPSNDLIEDDTTLYPWPQLTLYWDGDDPAELYNTGAIEKWDPDNPSTSKGLVRLQIISHYGAINPGDPNPGFFGDILGDWREEIIVTNGEHNELIIFTTDQLTDRRLYTLAHNPNYRNGMTVKESLQNAFVDYFIGQDMETPPTPNIRYVDA